jgi:prophage regulatory protein
MTATVQRPRRTEETPIPAAPLLRIADICRWLKISKPTFWRLRRQTDFPSPIAISDRVLGWPPAEIQAWLDARRRQPR